MSPFFYRSSSGITQFSLSQRVARVGASNRRARRWNATGRHGGQALILAVFIMLFAALLSSTFLVLVASNTQSVGRSIDKTSARRTADEGAQTARLLMAASTDADHWQPEAEVSLMGDGKGTLDLDELPPAPGDSDYDEYWTPLDKAMGWALTQQYSGNTVAERLQDLQNIKKNGGRVYIKVPDPRFSREATRYMLESRLLADAVDEVTDGGDKKFMLRVTSLGFSPENPEVWARQLLYKATNLNGSTFSYANFVSNYDFTKKDFASTQLVADIPNGTTTITLKNLGSFDANSFAPGQSLMLSDGIGDPFTSIIARRDAASVTLKTPVSRAFAAASTTASIVANLTSGLDAVNDNGARTTLDPNDPMQKALAPVHAEVENTPGATTDAAAFGNGNFYNLGLKVGERAQFAARPPYARSWGSYKTYSGQNALTVTGPLDRSSANLSLFDVTNSNATAQTPPALSAEQNKYFRLSFTPEGAMQVDKYLPEVDPLVAPRPVTPANIDLSLYQSRASVLIDNSDDFEKIGSTPLDNSQLQRLWQRKSFVVVNGGNIAYTGTNAAIAGGTDTNAMRLAWPRPGVDSYVYPMANGSLEQKGIRGWISPWEFLPRGALVELQDTAIKVTSDPLKDDGTIDSAKKLTATGAYSRVYTAAEIGNGILCATGNLRVRGTWKGTPLTIVSGHNIYIEGTIDAAPGKVALLAKDNVTVNPTQFLQRPAGIVDRSLATTPVDIASASGNTIKLAAGNIARFKVGDAVALSNNNVWPTVTKIVSNTLTLSGNPGMWTTGIKLRQLTDPEIVMIDKDGKVVTTPASAVDYSYSLSKNSDNIYRTVLNDGVKVNMSLRQAAERVDVTITAVSSQPKNELHVKPDKDGSEAIEPNMTNGVPNPQPEMYMWGAIDNKIDPTKGYFSYNLIKPDSSHVGDSQATLSQLQTQLAAILLAGGGNPPAWSLTLPTSTQTPNPYGAVPMRRLAAFDEINKPAGYEFKVPLTNSVKLSVNNVSTTYGSFWGAVANEGDQKTESLATVKADYYGHAPQWLNLFASNTSASQSASYSLQRDVVGDPNGLLPRHYYAGWHMEGVDDSTNPSTIAPLYSPKIQATIYAESGSWFVIPMPAQVTDASNPQAGRWRRSFYKITVEGNIAQGFSPTAAEDYDNEPDPDGLAVGATKRWLDALACPSQVVNTSTNAVGNWQTISYIAKPLPLSNDLALPSTAEVLYTFVE